MADPGGQESPGAPRPSSTTVSFVLLVVLVALTGAVVGNWLWLGSRTGAGLEVLVPLEWLVIPSVVILAATAVLTALEPELVIRRRRLIPVPAGLPGSARFGSAVVGAGLRRPPRLMYNPGEERTSARSVGRPGHHIVILSPAVLGTARRRPATFDLIVRHELAHIRSGDVVLATFAIRTWHVTLAALAVPVLARLWDPDLSLLPSYLVRAGILALVVYAVRAQLLRLREHHADVAATPLPEDRARFAGALAAVDRPAAARSPHGRRLPGWLALHPTVAQRAAVVGDPRLLGKPQPATLLAAGLAAAAAVPVVEDILAAAGFTALAAGQWPRAVLFGLVGAVGAAEVLRAGPAGARPFLLPALALAGGAAVGAAGSMAATGLEGFAGADAVEALIAALPVGALLLAGADAAARLAWRPTDGLIAVATVLGAAAAALTATVWAPLGFLAGLGAVTGIHTVLESSRLTTALAAVTLVGSALLVPRGRRRDVARISGVGLLLVALGLVALRLGVGGLGGDVPVAFHDVAFGLTFAVAVGLAALITLGSGAAAGVVGGAFVAAAGAGVLLVVLATSGGAPDAVGALAIFRRWTVLATVLVVPATAVAALARGSGRVDGPVRGRAAVAATAMAAVALVGLAVAWGAPRVLDSAERQADALAGYLAADLPTLTGLWQLARDDASFAGYMADPATYLSDVALPKFDYAMDAAHSATEQVENSGDPALIELHTALLDALEADRDYWSAVAGAFTGEVSEEAADGLGVEADRAVARFNAAYSTAAGTP